MDPRQTRQKANSVPIETSDESVPISNKSVSNVQMVPPRIVAFTGVAVRSCT